MAVRKKLLDTEKQALVDMTKANIDKAGGDRAAGIKATQDYIASQKVGNTNALEQAQQRYQNETKGTVGISTPAQQEQPQQIQPDLTSGTTNQIQTPPINEPVQQNTPQNQIATDYTKVTKEETPTGSITTTETPKVTQEPFDINKILSKAETYKGQDGNTYQTVRNSDNTLTTIDATTGKAVTGKYTDAERDSVKQGFIGEPKRTSNDYFSDIQNGIDISIEDKKTTDYKRAYQRKANLDMFSSMSSSDLANAIHSGKFLPGTQVYDDLKKSNPTLVADAEKQNSINSVNQKGKLEPQTMQEQISAYLTKLMTPQDVENYKDVLSNNQQVIELNKSLAQSARELSELKDQIEYAEEDFMKDIGNKAVSKGYKNSKVSERTRELSRAYNLALNEYNTTAGQIKNIAEDIKYEIEQERQSRQEQLQNFGTAFNIYQASTADQRALELKKQEQLLEKGDLNSTDPYLQQVGIENAVNNLYTVYPIPGMESPAIKVQKVRDLMAKGMTAQQAIQQLEQEIRGTQRYKDYITGESATEKPIIQNFGTSDKPNWKQYNAKTDSWDAISGIGGTGTGITSGGLTVTPGTTQNRPDRNNNPGNLKMGDVGYGVDDQNHTIFGDAASGYQALVNDITAKMTGNTRTGLGPESTLAQLGKVYAEDPNWANAVSRLSGYSLTTKLKDIDVNKLAPVIAKQEGFTGTISESTSGEVNQASLPLYRAYIEDGKLPSATALKGMGVTSEQFINSAEEGYNQYLTNKAKEISDTYPTLDLEFTPTYSTLSATQREALNKSLTSIGDVDKRIQRLKELFIEHGTEVWPTNVKAEMEALRQQIILKAKEVENLGVLNGPDLGILESLLPATTGFVSGLFSLDKNTLVKLNSLQNNYRTDTETKGINYGARITFNEEGVTPTSTQTTSGTTGTTTTYGGKTYILR